MIVLGHVTIDEVELPSASFTGPGGPPTYCSIYLSQVGARVKPRSIAGRDFERWLDLYRRRGVDTSGIVITNTCSTTRFRIRYNDKFERTLWLLNRCVDLDMAHVNGVRGEVVVIDPVAGEVPWSIVERVGGEARLLAIDMQGFIRVFGKDGLVSINHSANTIVKALEHADVVKASIDELPTLPSFMSGDKVVVISMGSALARMYYRGRVYWFDGKVNAGVVDPTGAGDVLICSMAHYMELGLNPVDAFVKSVALSTAKVSYLGPFSTLNGSLIDEIEKGLSRIIKETSL